MPHVTNKKGERIYKTWPEIDQPRQAPVKKPENLSTNYRVLTLEQFIQEMLELKRERSQG